MSIADLWHQTAYLYSGSSSAGIRAGDLAEAVVFAGTLGRGVIENAHAHGIALAELRDRLHVAAITLRRCTDGAAMRLDELDDLRTRLRVLQASEDDLDALCVAYMLRRFSPSIPVLLSDLHLDAGIILLGARNRLDRALASTVEMTPLRAYIQDELAYVTSFEANVVDSTQGANTRSRQHTSPSDSAESGMSATLDVELRHWIGTAFRWSALHDLPVVTTAAFAATFRNHTEHWLGVEYLCLSAGLQIDHCVSEIDRRAQTLAREETVERKEGLCSAVVSQCWDSVVNSCPGGVLYGRYRESMFLQALLSHPQSWFLPALASGVEEFRTRELIAHVAARVEEWSRMSPGDRELLRKPVPWDALRRAVASVATGGTLRVSSLGADQRPDPHAG